VLVDPIKPSLKAPGTQRLKLQYDQMLSEFASKFNLRRYTKASETGPATVLIQVGRCRLTPSNPR
jgi:hypothetical protein